MHLYFYIDIYKLKVWDCLKELLCTFDTAKENLALLLRRVKDSKTNVRKSALQVSGTEL